MSPDALGTRAHLVLPDLDDGFDNHNNYLDQRQNQNNDMSFTHLLSSRKAWTKGRAEPEVHNYFKKKLVMAYSKRLDVSERFFRFDPRQEVQTRPPVSAGGFVLPQAKPAMRLVEQVKFGSIRDALLKLYTARTTNLFTWLEDAFLT